MSCPIINFSCLVFLWQNYSFFPYLELFLNKLVFFALRKDKKALSLQSETNEKTYIDMTKADIVNEIYEKTGISRDDVMSIVEGYMEVVKGSLAKGENVYLRGFGTFGLKLRRQKVARNISAKTSVIVPEHNIPSFKPCKEFVEQVKSKN